MAQAFNELLDITGVILTKLDGDTRGGAALFCPGSDREADQIFRHRRKLGDLKFSSRPDGVQDPGMGDVLTLIEDAQNKLDEKVAAKRCGEDDEQTGFDLNDLLEQFAGQEDGTFESVLQKLPGWKKSWTMSRLTTGRWTGRRRLSFP